MNNIENLILESEWYENSYLEMLVEPGEICVIKSKEEVDNLVNLLNLDNYIDLKSHLFEILVNINYLPILDFLSKCIDFDFYIKYKDEDVVNFMYFTEFLVKLNDLRAENILLEAFDKLSEKDQSEALFNLDVHIGNKTAIKILLELYKRIDKNHKFYDYECVVEKSKKLIEKLKTIEVLEKKYKFKFSIDFEIKNYQNKYKDEFLSLLKKIFNFEKVLFRSQEDDVGYFFINPRTRLTFDLYTNKYTNAKDIANLFGNSSILYISGRGQADGKDVFYENAAWYKSNEDMPEEDKIFLNNPDIMKFRVYNILD